MQVINVSSKTREEFIDITQKVRDLIRDKGWKNGVIHLFCTHTTAAVTINEAADPSVVSDILDRLSYLVPARGNYKHTEGNSDAHIKSSLVGCSEQVLVEDSKLMLGTWQGIFFADFDGPRSRKVLLHFQP